MQLENYFQKNNSNQAKNQELSQEYKTITLILEIQFKKHKTTIFLPPLEKDSLQKEAKPKNSSILLRWRIINIC
jgi:hypothetical protein